MLGHGKVWKTQKGIEARGELLNKKVAQSGNQMPRAMLAPNLRTEDISVLAGNFQ